MVIFHSYVSLPEGTSNSDSHLTESLVIACYPLSNIWKIPQWFDDFPHPHCSTIDGHGKKQLPIFLGQLAWKLEVPYITFMARIISAMAISQLYPGYIMVISHSGKVYISHRIHVWYICANIWGILMVNVTIYSIYGSYGYGYILDDIPKVNPLESHKWVPIVRATLGS